MKVEIEVHEYTPERGMVTSWDDTGEIAVRMDDGEVTIVANASALRSLAGYLLVMAQEAVPSGHHIHLDEGDPLQPGSISLILEKQ